MSARALQTTLTSNRILWAPDGDEAFDDGGHVLQFDIGDQVRLIAFVNRPSEDDALREVWLNADNFYGLITEWHNGFEAEWRRALIAAKP